MAPLRAWRRGGRRLNGYAVHRPKKTFTFLACLRRPCSRRHCRHGKSGVPQGRGTPIADPVPGNGSGRPTAPPSTRSSRYSPSSRTSSERPRSAPRTGSANSFGPRAVECANCLRNQDIASLRNDRANHFDSDLSGPTLACGTRPADGWCSLGRWWGRQRRRGTNRLSASTFHRYQESAAIVAVHRPSRYRA